jgi:glycine/D-amino acid oxidase-like deaminating enzyme
VRLHHPARAISIHLDVQDALSSIRILDTKTQTESDIPCTKILIAAGAWSPHVFSTLFPTAKREIPISSLAGHSLLARASTPGEVLEGEEKICHAVFVEDNAGVFSFAPELFERRSGEIYIAGLNDPYLPLPSLPTEAKIDEKSAQTLKEVAKKLMSSEDGQDVELVRIGLCFRPISDRGSGVPILGSIPDADLGISTRDGSEGGVWLAAGHGPWGISLSLGTGKVMAEMIAGRTTSVDVRALRL